MSTTTPGIEVRVALGRRSGPTGDDDSGGLSARRGRLDLSDKLFQRSLWPAVSTVAEGERLAGPVVVELDPTSFCDLACPECISSGLLNQGRFSRDRLLGLVGELSDAGVRAVILIGGGEPLLHNAIGDVLQLLGDAGIAVGLTTNGTMIRRHLDRIAAYVSWTRVSVDAGTPACFERFRPHRTGRNVFDSVIANMRHLAAVKTGSLGYSFLLVARTSGAGELVEANFGDVAAAARLAREIGCDYFEVKPMYDMGHFLVEQPPALGDLLRDELDAAHALAADDFAVIAPRTLATVVDDRQYAQPKDYHQCPVTELRTLITSTGAYLCPYHRGNPRARYGDPVRESFATMWGGEQRRAVKAAIDPTTECRFHCIRHDTNLTLLRMAQEDLSHKVVADYDPFL